MSFFLRLFGSSGQPPRRIDEMTLEELFALLKATSGEAKAVDTIGIFRRLTQLALFEQGIPDQERNAALEIATALHSDIETSLAHDPEALEAFQEAADFHLNQARHFGYGSLQWRLQKQKIEANQLIEFIARPDHAELLPDFLEMMEPSDIAEFRAALLGQMGNLRSRDGEDTVDTLSRLAINGDGSMTMLLSGPELSALRNAPNDRPAALEVLSSMGI
uniref:hypothetical protein n=1 Tax=Altererythrobacter segetis TaxID=1104773 RepID=UPI001408FEDE|nr:hypothetical protein [Altererythrobacter segetis]